MSFYAFRAVRDYSTQRGAAKLALNYIADAIYDRRNGIAIMRYRELEASTNLSERYLRSILGQLVTAGELVVMRRTGYENAYAIPLYPGEAGYEPPVTCEAADHTCNGMHSNPFVDREALEKAEGQARRQVLGVRPKRGRQKKQPATAPDTLSWPAASDSPHPADPAGELAGPDTQPESEPADDAEAIRHADAICRMAALHWSEQQHKRYANRAERQHAYARSQGYADWEQYITVYARAHSQPTRTEAHA